MYLFEMKKPLLTEENLGDNNNIMDNVFYNMNPWPTEPTLTSGEQLFPPLPPRVVTTVDRGDQYVNPFVQPHVPITPMSSGGQNFPPMHYAHTQTDLPFEGHVIPTTQNIGQSSLNQPSTSGQHTRHA